MGNLIEKVAFVNVECTYNENVKHLQFIEREEYCFSSVSQYKVPIRHLHVNDDYKTILMCHGNAEDIGYNNLETLSEQFNVNVCVFDYSGYGLHTCKISSEDNCKKDVIAVYDYLINTKNINPNKIVIYGRSLGTGLACFLAYYIRNDKDQPQKLILISPLMSAVKIVTNTWVPIDKFMNYKLAPKINCSTLILHGNKDKIVPYECGYELSTGFRNLYKFYTLDGSGHNNIDTHDYYKEINEFLNYE